MKRASIIKKEIEEMAKESTIEVFKIKNRRGYAAIYQNHLTEGSSRIQALERMHKALKRKKKRD